MEFLELIVMLAVGLVVGVPIVAIIALVRSRTANRIAYDSLDKLANLRGDLSDLRGEISRLAERIAKLEAGSVQASQAESSTPAAATVQGAADAATEPAQASTAPPASAPTWLVAPVEAARVDQPEPPPYVPAIVEPELTATAAFAEVDPPPSRAADVGSTAIPAFFEATAADPPRPSWEYARPTSFAPTPATKPRPDIFQRLKTNLPLEQLLGMNLFAKIGIVLLVLGFALLGRIVLVSVGPAVRVALSYVIAGGMLGGGIWLEQRERYRLVGRAGIGGGWALLFFTAYAMNHVAPMTVLRSTTIDCLLMLLAAGAMVWHTLRYRSQVVTGLAFLLAFSTVALSQDTVYALAAGAILAFGIVAIALRMSWFELEVFGILASYVNHFYWLYKLYPDGVAGHAFPQFWPSTMILGLYWLVFRVSYVGRKIGSAHEESISTIAALANTMLLLAVMKFQSTHPELAFWALLALGGLEFCFGQLPVTRRRRAAFTFLTVLGTLLIFAAVPFKFSGNSIALFWMISAEVLLVAGIVQRERLFRRLGLVAGCGTGVLIVFAARHILELRMSSEALLATNGVLLMASSVLFCANAIYLRRKWKVLFEGWEDALATGHSYVGCVTAFLGAWALFPADWTALAWAALLLGAAFGARRLQEPHLLAQGWALTAAIAVRVLAINCHFATGYPQHLTLRLLTLPLLAGIFYLNAWVVTGVRDLRFSLRILSLWAGSTLLALLAWLELPQPWVAPAWILLAVLVAFSGRRLHRRSLTYQEHVLAAAGVAQLFAVNLHAGQALERYLPLIGCAAVFYAISRFCTLLDAPYRRPAAWLHTWTATALLAALAWHESPQPWLAVLWILFAIALAVIDRIRTVEELPWQAHVLAAMATLRVISVNFYFTGQWRGVSARLISIAVLVAGLYILARWVRLPEKLRFPEARHAYTWLASGMAACLLWAELQPITVALGFGIFGLALFEIGIWKHQKQLRLQGCALLAASFLRIFLVNLTSAALPGELLSAGVYTVAPLSLMYFYVWFRLQAPESNPGVRWPVRSIIAYFASGSVVAMLYFQLTPEWIVAAWALVVLALMFAALLLEEEIFLEQGVLLAAGIVVRGLAHNIFGSSYFAAGGWRGRFLVMALTASLLIAALPFAFQLRRRYEDRPIHSFAARWLAARRPEQILFFAPLTLIVLTIAVKMNPGMVTLTWGIVGVGAILLGLLVTERSYRLTGLSLLLLCVAKIVLRDAWQLGERDRYITFIVLGAALTLVSALYSKYRDQVSRLL